MAAGLTLAAALCCMVLALAPTAQAANKVPKGKFLARNDNPCYTVPNLSLQTLLKSYVSSCAPPENLWNPAAGAAKATLKKGGAEDCTDSSSAACYDHTGNIGIGPVKVRREPSLRETCNCMLTLILSSCKDSAPPNIAHHCRWWRHSPTKLILLISTRRFFTSPLFSTSNRDPASCRTK